MRGILFLYFTVGETKAQVDHVQCLRPHGGTILSFFFYKNCILGKHHPVLSSPVQALLQPSEKYDSAFYLQVGMCLSLFSSGYFSRKFPEWAELEKWIQITQTDFKEGKKCRIFFSCRKIIVTITKRWKQFECIYIYIHMKE